MDPLITVDSPLLLLIMTISFSDAPDPPLVETVNEASADDDDGSEGGNTEGSVSEFDGEFDNMPFKMLFGVRECRVPFTLIQDRDKFTRVCGQRYGACTRSGHNLQDDRGPEGYYETVVARKFVDGKLESFQTIEDRQTELAQEQRLRNAELKAAAAYLKNLGASPSQSEEAAYKHAAGEDLGLTKLDLEPVLDKKPATIAVEKEKLKAKGSAQSSTSPKGLGVAPGEVATQALVGMMEALAVAVTGLRTDLKDSLKAREPEEKPGPSKTARVTPRKPDCDHGYESSGSDKEGASYWYALVRGKGGVSGVYKDWGEVAPLFLGASGAILNKHKTRKEAEAMVRKYVSSTKGKASKWGNEPDWWYGVSDGKAGSDIYSTWEEAGTNYLGVSGAKVKKFRSYEDAEAFIGRYTIDHPFSEAEIEEGDTETVKKKGEPKGDGAPYQMGFHSAGGYRPEL
jgi:viroplasmin and RNaseH domain-containing protein